MEIAKQRIVKLSCGEDYFARPDFLVREVLLMKQKHEDTSLETSDDFEKRVIAYDASIVKDYLDKNTFEGTLNEKEKLLYDFNRESMGKSLDAKTLGNPILGALIERIARNTILLERFERSLILTEGLDKVMSGETKLRGANYIILLEEYRKCIETFCNVKWAYDQKRPQRSLAKLREIVFEEKE